MTQAFQVGLMDFIDPPLGNDKRFAAHGGSSYTVTTNANTSNGWAHTFTGPQVAKFSIARNGGGANTAAGDEILLGDGNEVRVWVEMDLSLLTAETGALSSYPWVRLVAGTGRGNLATINIRNNAGTYEGSFVITDANGTATTTTFTWGALSYRDIEIRVRYYTVSTCHFIFAELRSNASVVATVNHQITGADKTVTVSDVWLERPTLTAKGAGATIEYGRIIICGNADGVPTADDEGWPSVWNPSVVDQFPTSDVSTSGTWIPNPPVYTNIDDADGSYGTDENQLAAATTAFTHLMGWPTVTGATSGTIWGVLPRAEVNFDGAAFQDSYGQFYANNGGSDDNNPEGNWDQGSGGTGRTVGGLFPDDPDANAWTEARVNATNFGVKKPATAGAEALLVSAIRRYVVYGGTAYSGESAPHEETCAAAATQLATAPVMMSCGGVGII